MQKTFLLACFLLLVSCTPNKTQQTRVVYLECSNLRSHKNITLAELHYTADKLQTWKNGVMDSKLEIFWDPYSSNPLVGKDVGDDLRSTLYFAQGETAECVEFTGDRSEPYPLTLNRDTSTLYQSLNCSSDQIIAAQCSAINKSSYEASKNRLIERFETQ